MLFLVKIISHYERKMSCGVYLNHKKSFPKIKTRFQGFLFFLSWLLFSRRLWMLAASKSAGPVDENDRKSLLGDVHPHVSSPSGRVVAFSLSRDQISNQRNMHRLDWIQNLKKKSPMNNTCSSKFVQILPSDA